jgi:glutamate synthase (NADPH/NADH) large chain
MMRVCHLNTCPVGIATQDPELRSKFNGRPEHVIHLMRHIAEELRRIMAGLGFRTVEEMVGRSDLLDFRPAIDHWKAHGVDLSHILQRPVVPAHIAQHCAYPPEPDPEDDFEKRLRESAAPALENGRRVKIELELRNVYRTVGTRLSAAIHKRWCARGLPPDTITLACRGTAGQSFLAFGAQGITARILGDANDYFGKGLSGARLIIAPPPEADFTAETNVIVGNVALYGATSGEAFIRGLAGERFAVRNSGALAVVEGTGDHACEYMTGGRVVILGPTGRNTAAGMSGGVAYVLDEHGDFGRCRCNLEMVSLEPVADPRDAAELKSLIARHLEYTGSPVAQRVLEGWDTLLERFVKIMPEEYKLALELLDGKTNRI